MYNIKYRIEIERKKILRKHSAEKMKSVWVFHLESHFYNITLLTRIFVDSQSDSMIFFIIGSSWILIKSPKTFLADGDKFGDKIGIYVLSGKISTQIRRIIFQRNDLKWETQTDSIWFTKRFLKYIFWLLCHIRIEQNICNTLRVSAFYNYKYLKILKVFLSLFFYWF